MPLFYLVQNLYVKSHTTAFCCCVSTGMKCQMPLPFSFTRTACGLRHPNNNPNNYVVKFAPPLSYGRVQQQGICGGPDPSIFAVLRLFSQLILVLLVIMFVLLFFTDSLCM